jgi:2-methylaconitate cis-trans-isomerase PrpF
VQVRGTLVRGGTSKCWLFDAEQIEALPVDIETALVALFGAADPRQIDGVGGATSTTSKAAVVRRATRPDADVEYTFAQVGIGVPRVEWGSNCGNCATAVGLYAVHRGLVAPRDPVTTVRLHNTNSGTIAEAQVATPGGVVPLVGSALVPGVSQGGVPVGLSFLGAAGASTGRVLPTGRRVDRLASAEAGRGDVRATLVDAGAPAALVAAEDLGMTGGESLDEVTRRTPALVALRSAASLAMGLSAPGDPVSPAVPKVGVVGAARAYRTSDGVLVGEDEYDLAVRMVSMHAPHPAIGLTSAVAVGTAAALPGSVPAGHLRPDRPATRLRLGTPAGVVVVDLGDRADGVPRRVTVARAARCIASADLFLPIPDPRATARSTTGLLRQPA